MRHCRCTRCEQRRNSYSPTPNCDLVGNAGEHQFAVQLGKPESHGKAAAYVFNEFTVAAFALGRANRE